MTADALLDWVRQQAGSAPVRLCAVGAETPESVSLSLLAIHPVAAFEADSLRLELTYRVSVRLSDAMAAHELLCALAFAALSAPLLPSAAGLRARPLNLLTPAEALLRHGPSAEPCLHLVVTIERPRETRRALPVRERVLNTSQTVPRRAAGGER